ncbi:MAG: DUF4230 domain-containing protein [Roseiflexaceae bacterium]
MLPDSPTRRPPIELIIAAVALVLGLGIGALANRSSNQQADAPTATIEPWPTLPATFTPLPSPTMPPTPTTIATPTPIPLPVWEQQYQLTVLTFTVQTVVETAAPSNLPPLLQGLVGNDRVVMQVVGQAELGIEMAKVRTTVDPQDRTKVQVVLPEPELQGVSLLPDRAEIIAKDQRRVASQYPGLEQQAFTIGKQQLENQARTDTAMQELARDLARLRITEYLRGLGFEQIDVVFE